MGMRERERERLLIRAIDPVNRTEDGGGWTYIALYFRVLSQPLRLGCVGYDCKLGFWVMPIGNKDINRRKYRLPHQNINDVWEADGAQTRSAAMRTHH